jgi:biotin carboxyl carrier protein
MVAAYVVDDRPGALRMAQSRLELTAGLLGLHDVLIKVRSREDLIERLRTAMVVLETVNEQDRFVAAAMGVCNEVAARWRGERVTLGFLDGRYVRTAAISHTERFDRKMRLVQDIESAQEECLDQDTEIIHPRRDASIYASRATEQLSLRHGPLAIVSVPLRREGRPVGVLTLERRLDDPPGTEDVEMLRLTCDLVLPRLIDLRRRDRWIGARAAAGAVEAMGVLVGPTHTGRKLAAVLGAALLLFTVLGRGEDRVDASFEIAATEKRVVPAPFDGHVERVEVEPGDVVTAGATVLATLDTADLQMRLAAAEAEHASYLKESDLALRDELTVEVQIAEANLRRIEAEIRLLEHQIERATLVAPIDGTVVTGDLKRQLGVPVETGDVLFEIAQLDGLRAELAVPDDRIADLMGEDGAWSDLRGELASVTDPGDRIPFEVELVNPVAEVIGHRNVFRVRVRLLDARPWLRPGMKGVAKISVGERPYAMLWTRRLVSWIRMTLWI